MEDRLYWRMTQWTQAWNGHNGESFWSGPASRAAIRRHLACPFDAVISSGPPHFVHRAAMRFAKTTGVPWIADLRDPLISDFDRAACGASSDARAATLEREVLARAVAVVTTCPSLAGDLRSRYPQSRAQRIVCITNGFDREALRGAAYLVQEQQTQSAGEFHLVCAGSFYGRREVRGIIEPLAGVLSRCPQWRVRLTIAGQLDREQESFWRVNRPEWATFTGYIDRKAAMQLSAEAACNLLIVPDCRHGRQSIPGKAFELLALPRHVLALAPAGSDTEALVSEAGAATIAPFEDQAAVESAMARVIANHFAGKLGTQRRWHALDRYDRRSVAAQFSELLGEVVCTARMHPDRFGAVPAGELAVARVL
jgi:hypothetical protein